MTAVKSSEDLRTDIGAAQVKAGLELRSLIGWPDKLADIEAERDAWREAFTATRGYFRNNTGANARRYKESIDRLKDLKLLR